MGQQGSPVEQQAQQGQQPSGHWQQAHDGRVPPARGAEPSDDLERWVDVMGLMTGALTESKRSEDLILLTSLFTASGGRVARSLARPVMLEPH